MTSITENGFHVVYEIDTLKRVIAFLELGFGWDNRRSKEILECLGSLNKETPKAALFSEHGQIKIAILLFEQNTIHNSSDKVINLSAWYAKESHRGIDAVRFAKKLTAKLSDYTITNYTPSSAVKKLLIALGYKYMNVELFSYGAVKQFPFIQLKHINKKISFFKGAVKPVKLIYNRDSDISHAGYQLITVKKFGLKLRSLNIYLRQDVSFVSFTWLFAKCLLNCVVRVNIYVETSSTSNESPWLVKSFENNLYLYPQNSELSITQ
jgi:hypothetical protein